MTATSLVVGAAVCACVLAGMPASADRAVPLGNPGFEEAGRDGAPAGNLISNAIEFSHDGGQVTIKVEVSHGLLSISVTDEGIGIAEKDQARIFNRFVQLETGHKKAHHGHGLGLSLVKALLDRLYGTITVESRPGGGSTFSIVLPEKTGSEQNVYSEYGRAFLFEENGDVEIF